MPGVFQFSQTAANNATSVPSINWAENMAPSQINDSARAEMAAVACWRDDLSGSIVTSGISTAYVVASNQQFTSASAFNNQLIAFTPHVTNGTGPVTMTVDGMANLPLRSAPNTELPAGVLVQGSPYVARFSNADGALYLQSFYGNPYGIPIGGMIPYIGNTAPNASFALPFGQNISRTTYATLFALVGTTYGAGDGTATFSIPDLRGRIPVAQDNMGGTAAGRITNSGTGNSGINGTALGATGGAQSEVLVTANLPPYTPAGSITNGAITINGNPVQVYDSNNAGTGGSGGVQPSAVYLTASQGPSTFTGTAQGGSSTPLVTMPPSLIVPYILRIA